MFCATHPERQAERLCDRWRAAVGSACVRRAGPHASCSDACALVALLEQVSAATFAAAVKASRRSVHTPLSRLGLMPSHLAAWRAQRQLDAYLDSLAAARPAPNRRARPLPALRWARLRVAVLGTSIVAIASAVGVAFVPRPPGVTAPIVPVPPPVAEGPATEPSPWPIRAQAPPPPSIAPSISPRGRIPRAPAKPPAASVFVEDFSRGGLEARQVALTFDADSEASGAEAILEALRARGLRVTMFLTAGYVRKYPDLVRRIVADGHEVANHTKTHPHLTSYAQDGRQATLPHVTRESLQAELRATEDAFREVTGRSLAPLWRAPYGEHNGEIRVWAAEAGYRHVGWTRDPETRESLDTRDWVADPTSKLYRSAREIHDRILQFGAGNGHGLNGGIVLMHLGTQRRRDPAHARLPEILDALAARGYRLLTISELLGDAGAAADVAHLGSR